MSYEYSEDALVETATQQVLEELGWKVAYAWKNETFGANGLLGRENKGEVILCKYLLAALKKYNEGLQEIAYTQTMEQIEQKVADQTLGKINKEKYRLLTDGVDVSFTNANGELEKQTLRVFDDYTNNDFLAVRQLEITGELENIRLDYLKKLNEYYNKWIDSYREGPLLVIDVDKNKFAEKDEDMGEIINKIDAQLFGLF